MSAEELRAALRSEPLPDEAGAEERAWVVARAAYATREPLAREPRLRWRLVGAVALVLALLGVAVSPAGPAVGDWLRDKIGRERIVDAEPALVSLPAAGRLLVTSSEGVWIVQPDGSRRRLGAYAGASWSPRGLFVVAWRGRQVVALDPKGEVRWSLARPEEVGAARWAPSGFRIAYLAGGSLRVVAGDGAGDRLLARGVAPVAPAWRPGDAHVLAYVAAGGRIRVVNADSGELVWEQPGEEAIPRQLAWSADGERLLVLAERGLFAYGVGGRLLGSNSLGPGRAGAVQIAPAPGGPRVALLEVDEQAGSSRVLLLSSEGDRAARPLFVGAGAFTDLAWSPDGRFLLLGWKAADQWLFLSPERPGSILAVADVSRQFGPGQAGPAEFPRVEGWCCAPS